MNEKTLEWIRYAENDFIAIEELFATKRGQPYELVCFHCQQCIEKYLKAFLCEHNIDFERTHRLQRLLNLALPLKPEWEIHREELEVLTTYAT